VEERDGIMAPSPEHHAALLAHHLVHTDLLHVRSLLDIAYVFAELPPHAGTEYQLVCRELRLGRFAVILAQIMSRDFGIERPRAIGDGPGRLNALTRRLDLESWLTLVAATDPGADNVITTERIRRRTRLVDAGNTATLWEDVFFPPACFLKWRWNTNTLWVARLHHYRQLARKSMPILQSPARD
jgi:hypothetical protein